jgi:hypothetical protein
VSVVTNIIPTCALGERDHGEALKALDAWLAASGHGYLTEVGHHARGKKVMEALVFVGAFNMLDSGYFLEVVRRAPWFDEECVRVFSQEQHADWFRQVLPPATHADLDPVTIIE